VKRERFPIGASAAKTWDEVFASPASVQVHTLETGTTEVPLLGVLNLKHPKAQDLQNRRFSLPVFAHLIRHETQGDYLVDCGLDSSHQQHPYGRMTGLLVRFLLGESSQAEGQDAATQLQRMGIQLKGAFISHFHFDPGASLLDLPRDIQYTVAKGETFRQIRFLLSYENYEREMETLYEIDFFQADEMPILGRCADLFGDGSLWAISTPGHTGGHMSFLVNAQPQPILFTCDACLLKLGFEKVIGPGSYCTDIGLAQQSLERMVEFARRYPQVKVVYGHELPDRN